MNEGVRNPASHIYPIAGLSLGDIACISPHPHAEWGIMNDIY